MPEDERPRLGAVKPSWRSGLRAAGLLAIGLIIVVLLVRQLGGFERLWLAAHDAHPSFLGVALVLLAGTVLAGAIRWRLVLTSMGYSLSLARAVAVVLAALPLSVVAPSRANDLLRAYFVRHEIPILSAAGSVVAERAVDVQVLCWLALAGALVVENWYICALTGGIAALEWAVVAVLLSGEKALLQAPRFGRYRDKVGRVTVAFRSLQAHPRRLFGIFMASTGVWGLNVVLLQCLILAFGAKVPFLATLALWPVALFVGLLPVSLGGLGTRDAAFLYMLRGFDVDQTQEASVLASTLGYAVCTTWVLAVAGLPLAIRGLVAEKRKAKMN